VITVGDNVVTGRYVGKLVALLDELPMVVRVTRTYHGLHQENVADAVGVSPATVSSVEAGRGCTMHTARLLLNWLRDVGVPGDRA
jgi:transcriptional regulator with XRE-family HTH domain